MTHSSPRSDAAPYVGVLWLLALVRYGLDFRREPQYGDAFGVYCGSLALFLFAGFARLHPDLPWKRVPKLAGTIAVSCWLGPNFVSYFTAQLLGWTHGRFAHGRAPDIGATMAEKLVRSLTVAGATTIAGFLWCTVLLTLFVWLPGRMSKSKG